MKIILSYDEWIISVSYIHVYVYMHAHIHISVFFMCVCIHSCIFQYLFKYLQQLKLQNEDYKDMDPEKARADFMERVHAYEKGNRCLCICSYMFIPISTHIHKYTVMYIYMYICLFSMTSANSLSGT
jgi:hypothetical protein